MPTQTYGTVYSDEGLSLRLIFFTLAVAGALYRIVTRFIQRRVRKDFVEPSVVKCPG